MADGGDAGGAISGFLGFLGTKDTNAQNVAMQRETNQQNLMMSNTAHQREVADLRAAGLNPMLSAMGGSGAPTPNLQAPQVQNELAPLGEAVGHSAQAIPDIVNTLSDVKKNISAANIAQTSEQTAKEQKRKTKAEADSAEAAANTAKNYQHKITKSKFGTDVAPVIEYVKQLINPLNNLFK